MIDIQMFLEEDALTFLDTRLSSEYLKAQSVAPARAEESLVASSSRDYEQELFSALKAQDVAQAKRVLHELKDAFSLLPVGSPQRQALQQELHKLYQDFKNYLEDESTFTRMEEALDATPVAHKSHEQSLPPVVRAPVPSQSQKEVQTPVQKEKAEEIQKKMHVTNTHSSFAKETFTHTVETLSSAIALGDIARAHKLYTQAKNAFTHLSLSEQQHYKPQLLDTYSKIIHLLAKKAPLQKEVIPCLQEENVGDKSEHSTSTSSEQEVVPPFEEAITLTSTDLALAPESLQKQHIRTHTYVPEEVLRAEQQLLQELSLGNIDAAKIQYEVMRNAIMQCAKKVQLQSAPLLHQYYLRIVVELEKRAHQPKPSQYDPAFSSQGSTLLEQSERKLAGRP